MLTIELCILLGVFLLLIALGMPLFLAVGCSSLVTILFFHPTLPLEIIPQYMVGGVDSFVLLAIPFFFLAGELMNSGGLTMRIIRFSDGLVGGIRGGIGHVNVVTNMIWAGISGSAVADCAAIGTFMIPSMIKTGYSPGYSAALNAAAATIGPIIPPSIPMVIYGMIANVSVGDLFLSGVIPGIILGVYLMATNYVISIRRGYPKSKFMPLRQLLKLGMNVSLAFFAPVLVVGGIIMGVFTATESAAIAVLYSLIVGTLFYRELTMGKLLTILKNVVMNTGNVMIMLGVSYLFGYIIAQSNIATLLTEALFSISKNPSVILLITNIFFLILGMLMDPLAGMILFVPIFLPTISSVGINPVHFGLVVVLNLMIGLSTPPVGYLLYVTAAISNAKVDVIIREILPFLCVMIALLFICTYWPSMVLFLPNLIGK